VRPDSTDELMWGPNISPAQVHLQQPPLIGNRRQGPDLSQVGGRRSPLWLRMHFVNPPQVSAGSVMPSFAILFNDARGGDLIAYLGSLRSSDYSAHQAEIDRWQPDGSAFAAASPEQGQQLFERYCTTCHSANGAARQAWSSAFRRQPPNLPTGPYRRLNPSGTQAQMAVQIARIARFGIAGTDMPGHETITPEQAASIGIWLADQIHRPSPPTVQPKL